MTSTLKLFIPVFLLGAGVLAISGIREQYAVQPAVPVASISRSFLGIEGQDVPIDAEEQRVAGMSSFVLREFRLDSSDFFSVYVGYYDRQVQGKTIHSPKNCLPGAGWEILQSGTVGIRSNDGTHRVNRVVLANKHVQALVYYWYQGRGRVQASEYRVKWELLRDAAVHGRTEEALVRVVVPIAATSGEDAPSSAQALSHADGVARAIAEALVVEVDLVMPPLTNDVKRTTRISSL
jgi:EpsI family protein